MQTPTGALMLVKGVVKSHGFTVCVYVFTKYRYIYIDIDIDFEKKTEKKVTVRHI